MSLDPGRLEARVSEQKHEFSAGPRVQSKQTMQHIACLFEAILSENANGLDADVPSLVILSKHQESAKKEIQAL